MTTAELVKSCTENTQAVRPSVQEFIPHLEDFINLFSALLEADGKKKRLVAGRLQFLECSRRGSRLSIILSVRKSKTSKVYSDPQWNFYLWYNHSSGTLLNMIRLRNKRSTRTYYSLRRRVCKTLNNPPYLVVHQGLRSLTEDFNDNLLQNDGGGYLL